MRIGEVIGTVTLNRQHPSLLGARFKLVVPLSLDDLCAAGGPPAEEITVYDELVRAWEAVLPLARDARRPCRSIRV